MEFPANAPKKGRICLDLSLIDCVRIRSGVNDLVAPNATRLFGRGRKA